MPLPSKAEHLTERVREIKEEAATHKKAIRFHRRRLKECMSAAEELEKKLGKYGIELKIQK